MKSITGTNRPSFLVKAVHVSLLILVVTLVFSNTLDNAYHLDSIPRVKNNTEINEFWPPVRFFTDARTGSTIPQIAEYRPMMPLSHAINSEIAKITGSSQLAGLHVGNITVHIGSSILVYFLFILLISSWGVIREANTQAIHYSHQAFAAALIFAIHPISGSAVNYIAARDLLLMVFFFVASMLVYVGMRRSGDSLSGWLLSLVLLSLAILSKQVAILGFGLVFLFEWILIDLRLKDWKLWARTALFGVPTAAYFILRWLWIFQQNPADTLRTVKGLTYPLTMLDAHLFYYLRNFVWPFEMRALARVDVPESIFAPAVLSGLLFIAASLVIAWFFRRRNPLIAFAILAYWLLFSLTASIFPFRYPVSDYRQYLPLIFLSLVLILACSSLKPRAFSLAILTGLASYFSISSYQINQHWKTEESFWYQSVKYGAVALAHNNYALAMAGINEELAEKHYLKALDQNPFHIYANINLGMLYIKQQKAQEGLAILRKTTKLNPGWALSHYWLSRGLGLLGEKEESLSELKFAADLDPRQLQYQYEAALALQATGNKDASIAYLQRLVKIDPGFKQTRFLLGFAYQKTNNNQLAISEYEQFLLSWPQHVQTHFNLAYAYMQEGDCGTAARHFNAVLNLMPKYNEAHLHLSTCYRELGKESLALQHARLYAGDR